MGLIKTEHYSKYIRYFVHDLTLNAIVMDLIPVRGIELFSFPWPSNETKRCVGFRHLIRKDLKKLSVRRKI